MGKILPNNVPSDETGIPSNLSNNNPGVQIGNMGRTIGDVAALIMNRDSSNANTTQPLNTFANPMLMSRSDAAGNTQVPLGTLAMSAASVMQRQSLIAANIFDAQGNKSVPGILQTLQNALQSGQGTSTKLTDGTGKLPIRGNNNLIGLSEIVGTTGKKGDNISIRGIGTSLILMPGIPVTKLGVMIDGADETKLQPGQTADPTSPLNPAIMGTQIPGQAGQNQPATGTSASTDPNTKNTATNTQSGKAKDPGATDTKSLMEQFPKAEDLLPPRKEMVYDFVDDGTAAHVNESIEDDYDTTPAYLDIETRPGTGSWIGSNVHPLA